MEPDKAILQRLRDGEDAGELLIEYRDQLVLAVLVRRDWNRSYAAIDLKVHRNTIGRWVEEMAARGFEIEAGKRGVRKRST